VSVNETVKQEECVVWETKAMKKRVVNDNSAEKGEGEKDELWDLPCISASSEIEQASRYLNT
jgi:hypothetical protein